MLRVANGAVQIDVGKRRLVHEVEPRHDHPRHPEEDDLGCGDDGVAGIEAGQILGVVGPAQTGKGDQPGGEPGVQYVLVLVHLAAAGGTHGQVITAHRRERAFLDLAIPHRYPVAPPELARDAPVADALQPCLVVVTPSLRNELERAVTVRVERRAREWRHANEPLVREPRLDHGVAPVTVTHGVPVRFHFFQETGGLELGHYRHVAPRSGRVPGSARGRRG